ncbi:MAG: excinuclease ABC subunit UvrC [Bacteroidales bacterium]|nr:excinuclease ABC subunit UvrC [Bacteroidales bacterium]
MKHSDEHIHNILSIIPEKPGCYQYFDERGTIIYVGKAKNLKKRVSSYFNKIHDSVKTRVLVRQIRDIKYIVVDNEEDAFLLENSLIKQYQPRYNVLLKDDKSYPCITIRKEPFPRVFLTRQLIRDGSKYFGPYPSVQTAKIVLELIREIYPLRTCKLPLSKERIAEGRYSVCLQYHIKRCMGPCIGLQDEEDYLDNIKNIEKILGGNTQEVLNILKDKMEKLSAELRFEEAQQLKNQYVLIENYQSKSLVANSIYSNIDVFGYEETEKSAYINYLHINKGAITRGYTIEYQKKLEESKEELLGMGIIELRKRFESNAKEIIVPFIPDVYLGEDKIFTVPQRGEKKNLLALSQRNVKEYKVQLLKRNDKLNPEQRSTRILSTLQKDLQLKELPIQIECFDNSNIQGTNPVAACVVFQHAKPAKKEYRHFDIKTVVGPDDFSSMREIVFRRYKRLLDENRTLPNLIIIDGGKGQLSAAVEALEELSLTKKIPVIGIAKRLEEIYFPGDPIPLYLDKNSESLKLIQQLRDEAHRFGITHHRKKRSKQQIESELDKIKGIGEKSKNVLLKHYKSVKRIKEAPEDELIALIGNSKAQLIIENLKENNQL